MRRRVELFLSSGVRFVVIVLLIVAAIALPLAVVYRSTCPDEGGAQVRWSFVPPFDEPPEECRGHQDGFQVILDEVGA